MSERPVVLFEYGEDLGNGEVTVIGFDEEPEVIYIGWRDEYGTPEEEEEHAGYAHDTLIELVERFPDDAGLKGRLAEAIDWVDSLAAEKAGQILAEAQARALRIAKAKRVLELEGETVA